MGVMFAMSKLKIHELAKKLNKPSKEVMDVANKLGLDVKSHLNIIDGEMAKRIEKELMQKNNNKRPAQKQDENKKEKANNTPVIIRREVIISDEEEMKREEQKKRKEEKASYCYFKR